MFTTKTRIIFIAFCALFALETAASKSAKRIDTDIRNLVVRDWSRVQEAKLSLESRQGEAIPMLLNLMKDRRRVPLEATADLIYPGAKTFYGHGFVVDYDLDFLPIRAGWVLEEMTFQDFGFRAGQIDGDALLQHTLKHGFGDKPLSEVVAGGPSDPEATGKAVATATEWWATAKSDWSRLHGLEEALSSRNPRRQMAALHYLRFGETECLGLNSQEYQVALRPVVGELLETGTDEVRKQARYLLESGWAPR